MVKNTNMMNKLLVNVSGYNFVDVVNVFINKPLYTRSSERCEELVKLFLRQWCEDTHFLDRIKVT